MTTTSSKNKGGRPPTVTDQEVAKLEQAFAIGANVTEALNYAKISRDAYYRFLKKNPTFRNKFDELRTTPVLKALQTVYNNLDHPDSAKWLLERRRRDEYSTRQEFGGEIKVNLWQDFIRKANKDAPKYLSKKRGGHSNEAAQD